MGGIDTEKTYFSPSFQISIAPVLSLRSIIQQALSSLDSVEEWMQSQSDCDEFELVQETLDVARVIESQNVTFDSQGVPSLSKGVAKDRRISIEDPDMRHGRKSRSKKIDGYKRHVLKDLESGVVCAVALTRANTPESAATIDRERDLKFQNIHLSELHIDRAYLSSHWVTQRDDKLQIFCKAWPVKNSGRFDKNSFFLDWDTHLISCPNQVSIPFEAGKIVHFPQNECAICSLRSGCTNSKRGRTVSIDLLRKSDIIVKQIEIQLIKNELRKSEEFRAYRVQTFVWCHSRNL